MTTIFLALLPVFIVILVGFALGRGRVISAGQWAGLDHVCYFVLFPAIIFKEIAAADFSHVPVLRMAGAMAVSVFLMIGLLVALNRPLMAGLGINGPQFTSLVQGAARWHTFIAFAIIPLTFGAQALPLGAVGAAAMTPLLNILCVIVLARFAHEAHVPPGPLLLSILKNPFVVSSLGGVAWQLSGLELPAMALQVLDMIGRGALGLALLTVGAGLRIGTALTQWRPVALAVVLKLLGMPALMAGTLWLMGVDGEAFAVALLCGAVPTGSGAYVLARRMGGDAPMVANMLTMQVIAAAVTIPLVLWLAGVAR
ncbi:AEC family transporter [Aestuariivirga sp.]|uniref:AEC family transporter n=1 Tax=Aestuariivirga sp. TaxID=2650926 RepID=UPI0025B87284|nr:AEC family transporter [Aestuariivirga sp.]MCA3555834.1 AEC family transporter [Aestuariivirga sp.]